MRNTIEQVEALGGYKIVLADADWSYRQGGRGAATNHYETSPTAALERLPVSRIAAKDAVLFMWATWPIFIDSNDVKKVIRAWGFNPKTLAFLWVKTNKIAGTPFWGTGSWTRANSEFVILATRGDIRRINKGVHQLIESEEGIADNVLRAPHLGKHSAKPPMVRDRIIQLMGDLPAIELFARCVDDNGIVIPGGRVAEGWDQWGNECDSDIEMVLDT